LWLGEGENPYEFALYNSKFFIITSDSISMISEASISGKPIYVYQLPFKRKSVRFERFHKEFNELNITQDFIPSSMLNNWSYNKLNESERIAGIIKERIIEGINESK
ncbi:mitochondrial fission ELM1 family protein, partial [Pelagibacteraceae bacterium]|nr:mitochondrial fission ELM1 family protein [Pelagibacteraceae bacterium]